MATLTLKDAQQYIAKGQDSIAKTKIAESLALQSETKLLESDLRILIQMLSELKKSDSSIAQQISRYNDNSEQIIDILMQEKRAKEELGRTKYIIDRARQDAQIKNSVLDADISRIYGEIQRNTIRGL